MVAVLLLVWSAALPAMACSMMAPPGVEDAVDDNSQVGPVDGVFEYQHISWTPHLGYRAARTVSVVTRYWGRAPEPNGLAIHGDQFLLGSMTSSCGNGSGWPGTVSQLVPRDRPTSTRVGGPERGGWLRASATTHVACVRG